MAKNEIEQFVFLDDDEELTLSKKIETPAPETKLKHFIEVRFFPKQDVNYLYNVLSPKFLRPQLTFANNLFRSLENQTNKNFELVFIMNPAYFDNPRYEFLFKELQRVTTLPITFIKSGTVGAHIKSSFNKYEFVIQSKIDFDDFLYKDAVADTQSKVAECENILCYGYCKGYMYFDGEFYHYGNLFDGNGHVGVLQTLFLKSSFAKKIPVFTPYSAFHTKFKPKMKEFLQKNGVNFSEKMFQQNTSTDAYIYFRHDFSHNALVNNMSAINVVKRYDLKPVEGVTKKQLAEEFGFSLQLNSIK